MIGRRQDIPRETHLHAWVTPAAACFLTPQEIRAGGFQWEDGAGFHGNPQLPHPGWEAKEEGRPAEIAAGRFLCEAATLGWQRGRGEALMILLFQIRDALSLRLDSHLCSQKGQFPVKVAHLLEATIVVRKRQFSHQAVPAGARDLEVQFRRQ